MLHYWAVLAASTLVKILKYDVVTARMLHTAMELPPRYHLVN